MREINAAPLYKSYAGKPFTPFPGRGGARLTASRSSLALAYLACRNIIDAALYAEAVGSPLNRWITINWDRGKVERPLWATGRFLKLATDWLRSKGVSAGYVWVRESGAHKGNHVHIIMRVPDALATAFSSHQSGWLKACGARRSKGVVDTSPVGRSYDEPVASYAPNLDNILSYMIKGADDEAHHRLRLDAARWEPGGFVVGKRSGFSQNVGPAARFRKPAIVRSFRP